jgi:GntR family transcriptional repressor for pyruvate dehydrogenase complex
MFEPVSGKRIPELIADQIRERIFAGSYRVGDRLPPERELARSFNVSPLILREALHSLKAQGLVLIKKGATGGTFIAAPTHDVVTQSLVTLLHSQGTTIEQLTEARLIIEPSIAELAAIRRTEQNVQTLRENVRDASSPRRSVLDRSKDNVTFHRLVADICGNPVLTASARSIMDTFDKDLSKARLRDKVTTSITCEHEEILEAICDCDRRSAFRLMHKHIKNAHQSFGRADA